MSVLLYHQAARQSAPRLAAYMGVIAVREVDPNFGRNDFLIRYGNGSAVPLRPSERTINRRWALTRHSNRLGQLQRLAEAKVALPRFTTDPREAVTMNDLIGIYARDFAEGRQNMAGRGLTYYAPGTLEAGDRHDLYVMAAPRTTQFRVHTCMGRTRTRELVPDEPALADLEVWNRDAGFTFRVPDDIPPAVPALGAQAVAALGLDFGAVDIVHHADVGPVVLEVNTAPGLGDRTLEWYAKHLGWAIGLTESDMPRWDAAERLNDEEA